MVNALDPKGLETATAGSGYTGFPSNYSVKETLNQKPEAIITMTPIENITTITNVSFDYKDSIHPSGLEIIEAEWENKLEKYQEGNHTVKLRVQDEQGVWSDWVSKDFSVEKFTEVSRTFLNTSTGRSGANIDKSSGDLGGNITMSGGMYYWTVPQTGIYKIETYGASGGNPPDNSNAEGKGAILKGEFYLISGQVIKVLAGQRGIQDRHGGGGGGGTFVTLLNNTPLIIAGGGEGGGRTSGHSGEYGLTKNKDGDAGWASQADRGFSIYSFKLFIFKKTQRVL